MSRKHSPLLSVYALMLCLLLLAQNAFPVQKTLTVAQGEGEFSNATIYPAVFGEVPGIAVEFKGSEDLHYYAEKENSPAGIILEVSASAPGAEFAPAVMPPAKSFYDAGLQKNVPVYVGNFKTFIPAAALPEGKKEITVKIAGQACTSDICFRPFEYQEKIEIDFANLSTFKEIEVKGTDPATLEKPVASPKGSGEKAAQPADEAEDEDDDEDAAAAEPDTDEAAPSGEETEKAALEKDQTAKPDKKGALETNYSLPIMLLLALLGGMSFNIMPCVLPIIPIIIMRLIQQAKEHPSRRLALGAAFCGGIVLFFVAFAAFSAIIQLATGTVISMSDYLRYPAVTATVFLAMIVFGLFMFDLFQIGLPASVSQKSSSGSGFAGSIGMGFLAAVLSIPCTGAILAFVLVWTQTQTIAINILTFLLMGIGMAVPYALLILFPALLDRIPKPGNWMDYFKKAVGFLLIFIAVKLMLPALPKEMLISVLKYAVVLSFAVWMWGSWVSYSTPKTKKYIIRIAAVALAVIFAFIFLPQTKSIVEWQEYDQAKIDSALEDGQPVLIKFTADWCSNCKVVNKQVYKDPEVAKLINKKGVLPILGDTTTSDMPATIGLKSTYGYSRGFVPMTLVLLPDGEKIDLFGIFDKSELTEILEGL
ncbi:Thiol:disulfide interchange protein DsbD precursor [Anaerohalosphaera lusitana]|uniref:Thiol:disulfide interchange protein DsbD n=1 Tax=Anaerohalosphaera lusitana TaxID=1936003 RepID=A0A1U9NIC6_9BACT|nr:cytochrome c biogenesis protein CcdA [Anaerohalosphaera lusitana]AQT67266.1 Thiol:disulfide interchange protein DsbD precursor [Anaerohalosphaera lusitana]